MQSKKLIYLFLFSVWTLTRASINEFKQQTPIFIYDHTDWYANTIKDSLQTCCVTAEVVDTIHADDDHLYIIFNAQDLVGQDLPHHYIIYQTQDLKQNQLTNDYIKTLDNAVAIWDYSKENIEQYKTTIHHYYYFPKNYEFAASILLPCLLPLPALSIYHDLLAYSNANDTDISSHLPTIFCYGILQKPSLIVEAGVRGGESTIPLRHVNDIFQASLIGIDIDPQWSSAYSSLSRALFLCMDDRNFNSFYQTSDFKNQPLDIVFIDTSHTYQHTLQEIALFEKLLAENGILIFHDSNVTPYFSNTTYYRINGTSGQAVGNTRGVTQAIKEYFSLTFDEYQYVHHSFAKNGSSWTITHYPYCNGLTIIRLVARN